MEKCKICGNTDILLPVSHGDAGEEKLCLTCHVWMHQILFITIPIEIRDDIYSGAIVDDYMLIKVLTPAKKILDKFNLRFP